ncbi:hypothetical protein Q6286_25125, partial [Klebsiella pneumoniae]|uniref:hypothetical protein n=1 Tax=Klebsiella pneumoniae TaxID=573 RepID=UPI00272F1BB0
PFLHAQKVVNEIINVTLLLYLVTDLRANRHRQRDHAVDTSARLTFYKLSFTGRVSDYRGVFGAHFEDRMIAVLLLLTEQFVFHLPDRRRHGNKTLSELY